MDHQGTSEEVYPQVNQQEAQELQQQQAQQHQTRLQQLQSQQLELQQQVQQAQAAISQHQHQQQHQPGSPAVPQFAPAGFTAPSIPVMDNPVTLMDNDPPVGSSITDLTVMQLEREHRARGRAEEESRRLRQRVEELERAAAPPRNAMSDLLNIAAVAPSVPAAVDAAVAACGIGCEPWSNLLREILIKPSIIPSPSLVTNAQAILLELRTALPTIYAWVALPHDMRGATSAPHEEAMLQVLLPFGKRLQVIVSLAVADSQTRGAHLRICRHLPSWNQPPPPPATTSEAIKQLLQARPPPIREWYSLRTDAVQKEAGNQRGSVGTAQRRF